MNNKISRLLFLFFVSLVFFLMPSISLADEDSDLEAYVKACSYMLKANRDTFSKNSIDKLEKWISDSKKLIENRKALSKKEKGLEDRIQDEIEENFKQRNQTFKIQVNDYIKEEKIHAIFEEALQADRYFYYAIYKACSISTNYYKQTNENGVNFVESVDFAMTYRQTKDDEKKVDEFVNKWVDDNINNKMTDLEKTKLIHDFIVKRNSYNKGDSNDLSNGYSVYSPASILFGKGGVCNAYATLFDIMAKRAGLCSYYATGVIKADGQLHIWNMVKIDDDWYNIDLTWDDPILTSDKKILNEKDFVTYDYFLISDQKISATRSIDKDYKRPSSVNSYNHEFMATKIILEKSQSNISYFYLTKANKRYYFAI
ncbi:MAG: transglutaminase domain-containing protein [Peptoniphilaceae bacterium]|nr:transglutaminase domain-containing protein [Peptoniphilaceae bacterium]MDY6018546.1 transglutaminase domain-containing protein [Anaerococcus sp.]